MATDWVPAATAAIGAAAAIGGQMVSARFQGRNQERAEDRQRRERAVAVLADVGVWISDASPEVLELLIGDDKRLRDTMSDLNARWRPLRVALLALSVGHPSEKIRDLSRHFEYVMAASLMSSIEFLSRLARNADSEGEVGRDDAQGDPFRKERTETGREYAKAQRAFNELAEAIRET